MIAPLRNATITQVSCAAWHAGFLAMLPTIRAQARHAFRDLSLEKREDAIAEVIANACVAYHRLVKQDKADQAFPTVLARYAIAQFRAGRRVGCRMNCNDVLAHYAQKKQGFRVSTIDHLDRDSNQWREAVIEDDQTPVPDQAAFRIDFPEWLGLHSQRDRGIAVALAMGQRTQDVARAFEVSQGRVSQLRQEFHDSWQGFHGDEAAVVHR